MKRINLFLLIILSCSSVIGNLQAQQAANTSKLLDTKQQSIVAISALTAKGDLAQLQKAFSGGLEAGMTVNEIKEVLVHLSAYCGFPRSLQGINTFITVLDTRKGKGIKDKVGREATPVKTGVSKYHRGKKALETLTSQPEREPKTGYAAFAPIIDTFLKEHLFADIFGRDILTYTERELATVSALVSLGGVEPMMRSHMGITMRLGTTEAAILQLLSLIEVKVGKEEADAGRRVLVALTDAKAKQNVIDTMKTEKNLFAEGVKAPASNFTGTAWVNMLVQVQEGFNCSVGMVTFEPGARTNWHRHLGGQILLVTSGKGQYQEKGKPVRVLGKGDIIKCAPNVTHWHGAAHDTELSHIAISTNSDKGAVVWLQPVSDDEYSKSSN